MAQVDAATFVWEGRDRNGKTVKGEIVGKNVALVRAALRRQGIIPRKVKQKPKSMFGGGGKVTPKDVTVFSRQMATMMSSGIPLVQAFEIAGRGHEKQAMEQMLLAIKADIEAGNNITESLAKFPQHFNDLYCNLVMAGEQAGILETIMDKLATYMEKTEALKSKVKSALFYPAAVVVAAFVVVTILMVFVIPQFDALFKGFGADLPALTQMLINISNFFQEKWWLIGAAIVGSVFGFVQLRQRSRRFGEILDISMLKLPILGPIMEKAAVARFARTLATMFSAGTPLVESMPAVAGACGNVVFYKATMIMRDEISTGTQLQVAMQNANLFPNMMVKMVAIGEESGAIDVMLGKVADWYEGEVDDAVEGLSSLLEPLIMVVLGVIVGGIVIGMYLPIFKMGSVT